MFLADDVLMLVKATLKWCFLFQLCEKEGDTVLIVTTVGYVLSDMDGSKHQA